MIFRESPASPSGVVVNTESVGGEREGGGGWEKERGEEGGGERNREE